MTYHFERKQSTRDRILIIGSKVSWGIELVPIFEAAGFKVARVHDGPVTVLLLDKLKPDIVILDEAIENSMEICRQYADAHIPVILIGNNSSQGIWPETLLKAGAEFYQRIPICREGLVARVKAILFRYRTLLLK